MAIRHEWVLWGVRITRKDGTEFLASGNSSPVAAFFSRQSAVQHARMLEQHGFPSVPIQLHVVIEQTGRRPTRRGMAATGRGST